ncbi:helix-turn-helix transcriptional regulator [Colwellia psychrerythraea]|uniref:Uncharacterized protein n=1 Tax=Colwellia psychrerythraea TaxID=28229 RepID=A0A099KKW1_COLPS|nr:helix-turn-helix domain-containing protein [Colwellia psychrerythraea]KGJ90910.1 hypothetical protein GAB14E_0574 [Colwellia psychrerythraea]
MKVSNPLTIISIFAGLAEVMATAALINLPAEMQSIFIYFVMGFPTLIVLLFFIILVFKNKSLYAPSDFANQEHYMELNDLKRSIQYELSSAIETLDSSSTDEKQKLKIFVDKTLNDSFKSSRREQVLKHLEGTSSTTKELCNATDIHPSYGSLILNNLEDEGVVKKEKDGRSFRWSLNA